MTELPDSFPQGTDVEGVKVAIRQSLRNPNIGRIEVCELKDGPRAYRFATLVEILDGGTGEHHHWSLRLDQYKHLRAGWKREPDRSMTLEGTSPDEVSRLDAFLDARSSNQTQAGKYRLIDEGAFNQIDGMVAALAKADDAGKKVLAQTFLSELLAEEVLPENLPELFEAGEGAVLASISAAANLVEYRRVLQEMESLISDKETLEPRLQELLEANPWLFGSEYSQLLDRRTWTRDEQLDFMLRRTVDDFLEIVEIKRPFAKPLFLHDKSRNSYHAGAELSKALGQVMKYIEAVDADRHRIISTDEIDPLKIRARIIVGRDHDADRLPLRNLNGHLNRIEVLTFDQLLRIGRRVLRVFEASSA